MMRKNRSVLVTGGANGIGLAIAKAFLKNGDAVTILDIDKIGCNSFRKWSNKHGYKKALAIVTDITEIIMHRQIIEQVEKAHGPIEVLINHTGIGSSKSLFETEPDDFDSVLNTNIRGPFFLSQAIAKNMRRGSIVFTTSVHQDKPLGDATYAMSKAALKMLILEFALSMADKKIRVNGVAPGAIRNNRKVPSKFTSVPLGECRGRTTDIANAVLFLSSENASYITGETITIDGGLSLVNWVFQKTEPLPLPITID
ncbi:MAG: SDR family oxidoreductase [bacterium]|nr:SDR family oxidoreductase [bacterium]